MLTEERRNRIVEMVESKGIVQIQELANLFNISVFTIRRDLSDLETKGLIKKTHGGAIRVEKTSWLPAEEEGMKEASAEKMAIAKRASLYVGNGDTIFLIGSTINLMLLQFIKNKKLIVVTNSLDIAKALSQYENIETIIIGGRIKNYKGNILGSRAIYELGNFHFDRSFLPCAGVHSKGGITTSSIDSADFTRTLINSTDENIVVADYRKIGRITFTKICEVDRIRRLITDSGADKDELKELSKKKVLVDVVDPIK